MIQTSFFKEPTEEIQIDLSTLQPKKLEEVFPDKKIVADTYMIYPTGGYHPFYGVPNTFPRYQLPIWPRVVRIKFSKYFSSEEKCNNVRRNNLNTNQTISQINPHFHKGYFQVSLFRISTYTAIQHTVRLKNGKPCTYERQKVQNTPMHRAVAGAWIPNPDPEKFNIVMHINDDPTNYLLENLKWGNARMNAKGTKKHPDSIEQKYLSLVDKGLIKG